MEDKEAKQGIHVFLELEDTLSSYFCSSTLISHFFLVLLIPLSLNLYSFHSFSCSFLSHSLTHLLVHLLAYLLTHSLTPSLTPFLTPSLPLSLPHSLPPSLPHALPHSLPPFPSPTLPPSLSPPLPHSDSRVSGVGAAEPGPECAHQILSVGGDHHQTY